MSSNGKKDGIHVVGIDVESLHRIRVARVQLKAGGGLIRVTGRNRAGKTSLLQTIKEAFGGAGEVSAVPIHDGADAGQVRLELSNGFTITRRITEQNPKGYLTVVAPDGGKHGQAKLNEWLGANSFDPLAFFSLNQHRQREILLGLGGDPGLQLKIDAVRAEQVKLSEDRKPLNSEKQRCERVKQPDGERPEPVDVSKAMAELRSLQAQERDRGDLEREIRSAEIALQRNDAEQIAASNRIDELDEALRQAEQKLGLLRSQGEKIDAERKALHDQMDAAPSPAPAIAAVQERISKADAVAKALEPWHEYDRAQASLKEVTKTAKQLTQQINEKKAEELGLIAEAGIPVDGLTFDEETAEPLLNGFPLALASGGERIALSVAVAFAVNPELRVCLVDEANDLDLDALRELARLGEEHDFQIFACRIGIEAPGEILVDDGEARSTEPAEASAS